MVFNRHILKSDITGSHCKMNGICLKNPAHSIVIDISEINIKCRKKIRS